ncbi:MAG: class I SAM-dependent methyltransferase [Alphaproteobacteria bacterium]
MNDPLRAQYEAFPYPPRDPEEEDRRLITGSPSHILEINHYIYAGRRDFTKSFRALIAGGGTGDAAIMLAQHLDDAGAPGEVVYLDISSASAGIAEARAARRGLTNIRFVQGSVDELAALGLGTFDYIDCCGVLHHLEEPGRALEALAGMLAEDGGMGVMVYAPLGRTGVYHVQALLRMLTKDADDEERLATARKLIGQLPPTNWLRRNPYVGDHLLSGDAGIYDLLLHSRERAFTVPEAEALVRKAGLRLVAFIEPVRYEPRLYLRDPALVAKLDRFNWLERCAFAEFLCGNFKTHVFYVVKATNREKTVAQPDTRDAVPMPVNLDGPAMAKAAKPGGVFKADIEGIKIAFPMPKLAPEILKRLDGETSLGEIFEDMAKNSKKKLDWGTFIREFGQLYVLLSGMNLVFMRHPTG